VTHRQVDAVLVAGYPSIGADDAVSPPAFVGRERERALVAAALDSPPSVVLVEGEAGIGKSRLVRECLGASLAAGRVLMAVCPPLREPFPLGPVADALRRFSNRIPGLQLSPLGGALRPLFPEWVGDLPPALDALDDAAAIRHRLFRALAELVERLGVEVLVVEDAHSADAVTLEWLLMLTAGGESRLSVVVTFRPGDVAPESLLPRLTSRRPAGGALVRVALQPLDPEQTRRLVGSMFAAANVSEQFATFLHERTDGLPLAVEESVLLLRDRRDLVRMGGEWARRVVAELQVPPTLRDVVLERVQRLDAAARTVLDAAAVLGDPADEPLLGEVAGLDDRDAARGLGAALASGLLREAGPGLFVFRHPLHAKAVQDAIPASLRRRFDRLAARALQREEHPPVVRLCRHCRGAGDVPGWRRYGEAAARLALESGDHFTAVSLLHELLTGAEHPAPQRARLARLLGEATVRRSGTLAGMETVVRDTLAGVLADDDLPGAERGEIRLLLGWLLYQLADFDAGQVTLEAAVAELDGRPPSAARAMIYLAHPRANSWPAQRHLTWLQRAADVLRDPSIPVADQRALRAEHATALMLLGEETGWELAAELSQVATTSAERLQRAHECSSFGYLAMLWGRYGEARERLELGLQLADVENYWRVRCSILASRLHLDWHTGNWAGLRDRAEALSLTEGVQPADRREAMLVIGLLDAAAGERAASHRLAAVLAEAQRHGPVDLSLPSAAMLARRYLAEGRGDLAIAVTDEPAALLRTKGIWLWATELAVTRTEILLAAGRRDEAAAWVAAFAAGLGTRNMPAAQAALLTCRATLDEMLDPEAAGVGYARAADAWAAAPRPYSELLAREGRGRCLLATAARDDGLAVLLDAQRRMRELGASWDADRVAHALRQQGVEVTHPWRGGRRGYGGQLSPRERQVASLVSRGMTNRQVAESLYLSPKTVSRHLGSAMRKLGAPSRVALVALADSFSSEPAGVSSVATRGALTNGTAD
jgi:DNA-binding CsgD family transcriptional regulator